MTTKNELLSRVKLLEEKLNKIEEKERDRASQMLALRKCIGDYQRLDNKQGALCHEIYKLTKRKEIAHTERAGEVTLDTLAKLIIDGTPITITKIVEEEITPMCHDLHKSNQT